MHKNFIRSLSKSSWLGCKPSEVFVRLEKYKLKESQFTKACKQRLESLNPETIETIVKTLTEFGAPWQRQIEIIQNYDDLSIFLDRSNLWNRLETLQKLNLSSDIFFHIISKNPQVMSTSSHALLVQFNDLKEFFSAKNLTNLLVKSPSLLTNSMDGVRYKFCYLYFLMGFRQNEMSNTFVFNHSIDHIRERHLFLERANLFDKPNKKGISKVQNPLLIDIVDSSMQSFLKISAKGIFTEQDFETFCAYLRKEDFTDELLGFSAGRSMRDTIVREVRAEARAQELLDK